MAQFVVTGREGTKVAAALAVHYPNDHIKVWDGLFLVSDDNATAQQVCQKITGTNGGELGTLLVTSINGYYGYAGKNIWEWLSVKGTSKL